MTHREIQKNNHPDTTDGKVGYKRPPVKSRFRKGQSGNPRGRRKGQRNMGPVLAEVLRQTVTVKQEGKSQRMSKGEALIQMLLSKALNGDGRTIKAMLDLAQKIARIDTPELKLAGHGNYEFMLVPGVATSSEEWQWEISNRHEMATIRETVAAARAAGTSFTTSQRAFLRETVDAARAAGTLLTTSQIEAIREPRRYSRGKRLADSHAASGQSHKQKSPKARPSVRAVQGRGCCPRPMRTGEANSPSAPTVADRHLSTGQSPTPRISKNRTRCVATPSPRRSGN
jgi:hypothetical protein